MGWDPGVEQGCRDCILRGVSGRAAASPAWLLALHMGCQRLLPRASECPVRGAGGAEESLFMMQDAQPPALLVPGGVGDGGSWHWLLQADLQPQAWVSNIGSGVCRRSGAVPGVGVHLYLLRAKLPGTGRESFHLDMTKERCWLKGTTGPRRTARLISPVCAFGTDK